MLSIDYQELDGNQCRISRTRFPRLEACAKRTILCQIKRNKAREKKIFKIKLKFITKNNKNKYIGNLNENIQVVCPDTSEKKKKEKPGGETNDSTMQ